MDFGAQAELWFGRMKWPHLALTLASALLLLLAVDRLVLAGADRALMGMAEPAEEGQRIVKRWLRFDPRGFVDPDRLDLPEDRFDLGWIVGSSITIQQAPTGQRFHGRREYELTEVLLSQVSEVEGRPLWIHQYMVPAMRSGDVRRAVLDAAADPEIDAILLELNPPWVFNDWLLYSPSNQKGSIVAMEGARWGDLIDILAFARVSDIAAGFAARGFVFIRDRYVLNGRLPAPRTLAFPLLQRPRAARSRRYLDLRPFYPDRSFVAPEVDKAHESYRSIVMMQTLTERGYGVRLLRRNLQTLARAGKPTLLYMPPLPVVMRQDPEFVVYMDEISALVRELAEAYGGPNIVVTTHGALGTDGAYTHRDIVHLSYGQGAVDEIERLLREDLGLDVTHVEPGDVYR